MPGVTFDNPTTESILNESGSNLGQREQNWLTYSSPNFGYSIQYPPDWEEFDESNSPENTSHKLFGLPEKYSWGAFGIDIEPLEKYLDTDTLTLKTRTPQDYVRAQIAGINSDPNWQLHKNISTTIGQNHYPAVQVHFSVGGLEEEYRISTYMVNDGYLYLFFFFAPPLDVPELLPTVEKMLASFQITK